MEKAGSSGGRKRKGVTPTVPRPSLESLNLIDSLISPSRIRDEVANWLTDAIGFLSLVETYRGEQKLKQASHLDHDQQSRIDVTGFHEIIPGSPVDLRTLCHGQSG